MQQLHRGCTNASAYFNAQCTFFAHILHPCRQFMPEERPPALIQLCIREKAAQLQQQQQQQPVPGPGASRKRRHEGSKDAGQQQQQQQQQPAPQYKCYLFHIACLKDRAHPDLKSLLENDKVRILRVSACVLTRDCVHAFGSLSCAGDVPCAHQCPLYNRCVCCLFTGVPCHRGGPG